MKKRRKVIFIIIAAAVGALCLAALLSCWFRSGLGDSALRYKGLRGVAYFGFDTRDALAGWEEKIFKGRVVYALKSERGEGYLNAYSRNSASGLLYWLNFNPRKNPMVGWRWKVVRFPEKQTPRREGAGWLENEDYAVRFYIIFPRFPIFRLQCLEYVWDRKLPAGTVLTNPNFKNLKIIIAESGEQNLGKWVRLERNVYEDFKKIFGREPGSAGAIAVMTNSDNTQSIAEAQYNDIEVGYEK